MPITSNTSVTIPAITAVPERTYDHIWLTDITIKANSYTDGLIEISHVPYDGATLDIALDHGVETISTDELWTAVDEVSAVAVAMQAIFDAVVPLRNWLSAREV